MLGLAGRFPGPEEIVWQVLVVGFFFVGQGGLAAAVGESPMVLHSAWNSFTMLVISGR